MKLIRIILLSSWNGGKTRSRGGRAYVELTLSFPDEITVKEALLRMEKIRDGIVPRGGDCEVNVLIIPISDMIFLAFTAGAYILKR